MVTPAAPPLTPVTRGTTEDRPPPGLPYERGPAIPCQIRRDKEPRQMKLVTVNGHQGPDLMPVGETPPMIETTQTPPAPADPRAPRWWQHRPPRAVIAAVPVMLVNACAFFGQLAFLRTHLPWVLPGQILVAVALESVAVYLAYHAHVAQLADDSSMRLRLAAELFALIIGAMNYSHYAHQWRPDFAAVAFGLCSAISPWLWSIHSRRESRDALKAAGLIDGHAVRLGATRWTWHPIRSARVMYGATWEGITSPAEAIALLGAADLPVTEIDAATIAAMSARDRLIWAWGVIGSTDIGKARALLASKGARIDESHARTIRRQLDAGKAAALEDGQP
jgi:hypothetical protein